MGTSRFWLRRKGLGNRVVRTMAAGLVILGQMQAADAAPDDPLVQDLLKKLEERDRKIAERDAMIDDLKRRMDRLEQRVGSEAPHPRPPETQTAEAPPRQAPPPQARGDRNEGPGGKASSAPGAFDVDEDAAERALERTLTQVGALLLPFGRAEIQPFVGYVRRETDFPALVSDPQQGRIAASRVDVRADQFDVGLASRWGLPFDSQLELTIPYRIMDETVIVPAGFNTFEDSSDTGSSIGDIRVGLAKTLFRERNWIPDVIARVTWDTDTGDRFDDRVLLGGQGFNELRGSITLLKRQDPLAFTGTFFYQGAFEKDNIKPGDEFGLSVGAWLAASPETSLFLELQQVFPDKTEIDGNEIAGSDRVSSLLVFGASSLLGRGTLVSLSAGIGLTDGAPDYTVNLSLPVRFDLPLR